MANEYGIFFSFANHPMTQARAKTFLSFWVSASKHRFVSWSRVYCRRMTEGFVDMLISKLQDRKFWFTLKWGPGICILNQQEIPMCIQAENHWSEAMVIFLCVLYYTFSHMFCLYQLHFYTIKSQGDWEKGPRIPLSSSHGLISHFLLYFETLTALDVIKMSPCFQTGLWVS